VNKNRDKKWWHFDNVDKCEECRHTWNNGIPEHYPDCRYYIDRATEDFDSFKIIGVIKKECIVK
jgi:hypothetical protein